MSLKISPILQKLSSDNGIAILLSISLFALPFSSSGKSIAVLLALLGIVLNPICRGRITLFLKQPWCLMANLFFFTVVLACFWGPADIHEKIHVVEKYSKLLYLPIIASGFMYPKTRYMAMHAFLAAMLIVALLTVAAHFAGPSWVEDPDKMFRNHIMIGFMMSYACYLCMMLFKRQNRGLPYLILAAFFSYHVFFINAGRTAYIIYLLLTLLFIVQFCTWKQAAGGLLLVSTLFVASYFFSPMMQERVDSIVVELKKFESNDKNTSLGYRIQFHDFARIMFLKHPWSGNGTGSYTNNFKTQDPVPEWGHYSREPHNQFWLVLAEQGVFGLALLLLFFGFLLTAAVTLPILGPVAIGMIIPFLAGNFTDSLLFYSGSGYFFILFVALALGEQEL